MPITRLDIPDFLQQAETGLVLDVRSPGEFNHGHIPQAQSLSLFSDEERKIVGTLYKQESREVAIKKGLEFFGVKMKTMVEEVENLIANEKQKSNSASKNLFLHCWRGGMRSSAVAWLLDLYGFKVFVLKGGYKAYRNFVLQSFEKKYSLKILSGKTGSGKTDILKALQNRNEAVIDLEALAHHKGSAFGAFGELPSPTQEQFENNLCLELLKNETKTIWCEDESQRIGLVNVPKSFWLQMRNAEVYFLEIPFEERLNQIVSGYGKFNVDDLKAATLRIQKRLGGLDCKNAIQYFDENNLSAAFAILLKYYDKHYLEGLAKREKQKIKKIDVGEIDVEKIVGLLNS